MEKMEILLGEKKVLYNGTIVGISGEPVIFKISSLIFEINITDDLLISNSRVLTKITKDNERMIINLINFDNSLGRGNIKPLVLGHLGGEELLLSFKVYSSHNNDFDKITTYSLEYTFYSGEKVSK